MNRILRNSIVYGAMTLRCPAVLCLLVVTVWAGDDAAVILRKLRDFQTAPNPAALNFAWPYLDSSDTSVREAARIAVQAQPFEKWKDRAMEEKNTWASLELLRALVESCPRSQTTALSPHICEQITTLRLENMDVAQLLAAIRLTRSVFERLGPLSDDELQQMRDLWTHLAPPTDAGVARERQELVEFLRTAHPR